MNNHHRESVLMAELHIMGDMVQRARLEATKLYAQRDELLEALRLCRDQMLQRGVLVDPEHPDRIAIDAAEHAIKNATRGSHEL